MNTLKTLFIVAALIASSQAMAEGGGDRALARMEASRKDSMESYQVAQKQSPQSPAPESQAKEADHTHC